uniref:Short neurotoxin MS11 n=1 Tax=Micrurus surinamensis TaxID=129470 RepID=3SX_MICSU|nr:RecName: Full=Short neurotoxin MS11; AltName: Full=Three-finger toxin; Short=3FTx [Micrurus surinamensis]
LKCYGIFRKIMTCPQGQNICEKFAYSPMHNGWMYSWGCTSNCHKGPLDKCCSTDLCNY